MATIEELSAALVKADAAGNTADAKALADAIRQMRVAPATPALSGADLIPGQRVQAPAAQTTAPVQRQGGMLGETLGGLIETPMALAATTLGGPVTYLSGAFGPEVQRKVAGAIQYEPRTQMAQQTLEAIASNPIVQKLPPFMPAMGVARTAIPAARAIGGAVGQEAGLIRESVQAPLAARAERVQQQRVRESQINAPRIDAAKDALELGIALDPAVSNPTRGNVLKSRVVGTGNLDAKLAEQNLPKYTSAAKRDMGLPDTVKLDAQGFEQARSAPEISKPYETVRGMKSLAPDDTTFTQLDALRATPLVGDTGQAAAANALLDAVKQQLSAGVDGRTLVDSIRQRRREAQAIYNQQSKGVNPPSPEALAKADMNMGVANVLEGMIENNITNNPTLLGDFRNARAAMAKTYDYERATNFATGNIDPQVIAKMAAEGKPMSGLLAKIGNVAANFPEVSRADVSGKTPWGEKLTRSSPGGTVGALAGSVFGLPGSIAGGVAGAVTGNILTAAEARRMATPGYQAKHAVPKDYRPPVNNLRPAEINYGPNQLVPYDFTQSVLTPEQAPYQPNFVFGRGTPEVRTGMPETPPLLGAPSAEGTLNALRAEDVRRAGVSRALGQEAEVRAAAAEAAARRPTSGEVILDINPLTGVPEISRGIKGATPSVLESTGKAAITGAEKMRTGQAFLMTAEEKIQWGKSLLEGMPIAQGELVFGKLTPQQITNKMADREWAASKVAKARDEARAFADIAARAADERARQAALASRERMLELADQLEETLRAPRPTSGGGQGPKTRAAIRNQLVGGEKKNNLAP